MLKRTKLWKNYIDVYGDTFYNSFENAIGSVRETENMKWRRSGKHPKWFKGVKRIREVEEKAAHKSFRTENLNLGRRFTRYKYGHFRVMKKSVWKEPAPLIDVFPEKDSIVVVAELKGFKRENIKANVEKQRLVLAAKAQGRKYYRVVNLPDEAVPEKIRVTYKNGVVEIRLRKASVEKTINKLAG